MPFSSFRTNSARVLLQYPFLWLSAVLAALLFFAPPPSGLSLQGWQTLLLMGYTVSLWATEAIEPPLTALLVMVLFSLMGILTFPKAVAGFGDTTIWLLLGVYIISAAMRESGLDRRIALNMLNIAQGNTTKILFMANVTTTIFVFLLPASSGRASLLTPICIGIIKAMGLGQNSNIAKGMLISVSYASLLGSLGLLTGAVSMAYSAALFDVFLGVKLDYLRWMGLMLPISLTISLLMCPLLLKTFPPELRELPGGTIYIRKELNNLGKLTPKEIKVLSIMTLTILCWIFESTVKISIAQSCLAASIAFLLPGIGFIPWKRGVAAIEWNPIFVLGASLAMVEALKTTHAIEWFTTMLFSIMPNMGHVVNSIIILIILVLIRACFPNILAMTATTLPILFALAPSIGLSPLWLGLLGVCSTVVGLFFPSQSITHLVTYAAGYYSTRDMFRAGRYASIVVVVVILLFAHIYWPWIGISPLLR